MQVVATRHRKQRADRSENRSIQHHFIASRNQHRLLHRRHDLAQINTRCLLRLESRKPPFLYFVGRCAEQSGVPQASTARRVRDVVVHLRIDALHEEVSALVSADHRVVVQHVQRRDASRDPAVCELHQLIGALAELHEGHVVRQIARVEPFAHRAQLRHEMGHRLARSRLKRPLCSRTCGAVSSFRGRRRARSARFPRPASRRTRRARRGPRRPRCDAAAGESVPRRTGRR